MSLGHSGASQNGLGGGPPRRRAPLHVVAMAIALVLAAVLGATVGLVWQSSGLGGDDAAPEEAGGGHEAPIGEIA